MFRSGQFACSAFHLFPPPRFLPLLPRYMFSFVTVFLLSPRPQTWFSTSTFFPCALPVATACLPSLPSFPGNFFFPRCPRKTSDGAPDFCYNHTGYPWGDNRFVHLLIPPPSPQWISSRVTYINFHTGTVPLTSIFPPPPIPCPCIPRLSFLLLFVPGL